MTGPVMVSSTSALPAMVRAAAAALAKAETAAQVLEARERAGAAYDAAKRTARLARAKDAHDSVVAAAHRAQADALEIEAQAKRRLADEYDGAQARGEVGKRGQRTDIVPDGNKVPTAEDVGLNRKQVFEARQIRDALMADPDAVRAALDEIVTSGDEPTRAALKRAIVPAAKDLRAVEQKARHAVRLAHMERVAEKGRAAAPGQLDRAYGVYYADPPWQFAVRSEVTGREKSAENHYPTMPTGEIAALMAGLIGGDNPAVLFLWATNPMLPAALRVLADCGFAYVHHWIWDKEEAGTGYWGRDRHELLLIGRRGDVAAPLPGTQPQTVFRVRKGPHSAKPDVFAETIERLFPGVSRIELFARTARPGWDAWGFEAAETAATATAIPSDLLPGDGKVTELTIGGMRKNGSGVLAFSRDGDGYHFTWQLRLRGVQESRGDSAGTTFETFSEVALAALGFARAWLLEATQLCETDTQRACAEGGAKWCVGKLDEWGLS